MDKFDEKVIGYDSIKETLRQIADVLKRPEAYKEKGVSMPRGLLMESALGLGKSLMASILMEESGRKSFVFRRINEGNTFLGEMKDIFDVAKEEAPSILLLEDLNLYVESNSPYAPEWACLQACIDETSDADIFVIATTNDTRYMPQSLLRPGRFDYILNLNPPLGKTAENIVSYYLRDKNLAKDVQISDIVKAMPQVSCATLETVMNLAAINSVYRDHAHVQKEDIIDQIFIDALQDEIHICPCHGDAAGQGFFIGLGVDVVLFQKHQPDALVIEVFIQSKTLFCISGHPGY